MIFSVGYQGMRSNGELVELAAKLRAPVWDCRTNPVSRKPGFGTRQLEEALQGVYGYVKMGAVLGGKWHGVPPLTMPPARITAFHDAIANLARRDRAGERFLLMCLEEAPGDCHRHHTIALALMERSVVVHHVYRQEVIRSPELARSIAQDNPYDFEPLDEVLARDGVGDFDGT